MKRVPPFRLHKSKIAKRPDSRAVPKALEAIKGLWLNKASGIILCCALVSAIGLGLLFGAFSLALASAEPVLPPGQEAPSATLSGLVRNADGPVSGATVRVQATDNMAVTDENGAFMLAGLPPAELVTITASAPGHYINWTAVVPDGITTTIELNEHYIGDDFEYDWAEEHGIEGSASCGVCHTSYPEWLADGHSQAAVNPRFLSMYAGTDVEGNQSPPPPKNNVGVPLPPDLSQPYYGPGYKLDFPTRSGSCAACHTPMAAKQENRQNCGWSGCHQDTTADFAGQILDRGVSPLDLKGDAAEGISCEFCHKIGQVALQRETGLPYPDLPGILSLRMFRPAAGHDLIFGPVDDIARTDIPEPRDVHLPMQEESRFCAGCHYGILGGVVVGNMDVKGGVLVYSSFSEWLNSPYSDPETGQTCQDCHMRAGDVNYFAYPTRGGVIRDPNQVHNHRMFGESMLQNAMTLTATAQLENGQIVVDVTVTNDQTGHHVPTDSPLRHVMLVVEAQNGQQQLLPLVAGPLLPEWTGDFAGKPGHAYAKILQDEWTGEFPTGAIWRPVQIKEDTRLAAMSSDVSQYTFAAPDDGSATVKVQVLYRKAFQQLAEWKGWDDPVVVMEKIQIQVGEP